MMVIAAYLGHSLGPQWMIEQGGNNDPQRDTSLIYLEVASLRP